MKLSLDIQYTRIEEGNRTTELKLIKESRLLSGRLVDYFAIEGHVQMKNRLPKLVN